MIHTITPGYYCVPSIIEAITGADMLSVIIPALNRQQKAPWLLEEVVAVGIPTALKTLNELGYSTGIYRNMKALGTVYSWKEKFPEHTIVLFIDEHALVIYKGMVYDNHAPMGRQVESYEYTNYKVHAAYLVKKMP
jgi:hypothetical protein